MSVNIKTEDGWKQVAGNVKDDILPTVVNDRFLHTNEDTGELEWSEVESGKSLDFNTTPIEIGTYNGTNKVYMKLINGTKSSSSTVTIDLGILPSHILHISGNFYNDANSQFFPIGGTYTGAGYDYARAGILMNDSQKRLSLFSSLTGTYKILIVYYV